MASPKVIMCRFGTSVRLLAQERLKVDTGVKEDELFQITLFPGHIEITHPKETRNGRKVTNMVPFANISHLVLEAQGSEEGGESGSLPKPSSRKTP